MSMSSLILELWHFPFVSDWPEILTTEIPPSEISSISVGWGKLGIPNLTCTFHIKCYWMLQNPRVTAFTVSELLRENQQLSNNFAGSIQLLIWNKTDRFIEWSKFKKNFHLDKRFLILVLRYSVGTTWKSQEPDDVDLTVHKQILYTIIILDKWVLDIAVEKVLDEHYDNGSQMAPNLLLK